jgi:hypothetical protein
MIPKKENRAIIYSCQICTKLSATLGSMYEQEGIKKCGF